MVWGDEYGEVGAEGFLDGVFDRDYGAD